MFNLVDIMRFEASGFASLELLIYFFVIALMWYLLTPMVFYFAELAMVNSPPDAWGLIDLIKKIYLVFPLIMLFGSVLWYLLAVQRRETTSRGMS
jgi:hypothetical protein